MAVAPAHRAAVSAGLVMGEGIRSFVRGGGGGGYR